MVAVVEIEYRELTNANLVRQYVRNAQRLITEEKYTEAKEAFDAALRLNPGDSWVEQQLASLNDLIENANEDERRFQYLMAQGDGFFEAGNFDTALMRYEEASALKGEDEYLIQQIDRTKDSIKVEESKEQTRTGLYNAHIAKADSFLSSFDFDNALSQYQAALRQRPQDTYALDQVMEMTKAFPENTELEARLTFSSSSPGAYVRSVAADPYGVTVRVRQSLVKLPELGSYTPRKFDPRSGSYGIQYVDYAQPINEPKEVRYTVRHRLEKKDPNATISDPVEPIVYYLDRGAPEPIRSALLDGARWWGEAFEQAGFSNAYRVEILPEGADPMDLRYNVIQWVHRSTRGWSYGRSVRDPRTGEILKGHAQPKSEYSISKPMHIYTKMYL